MLYKYLVSLRKKDSVKYTASLQWKDFIFLIKKSWKTHPLLLMTPFYPHPPSTRTCICTSVLCLYCISHEWSQLPRLPEFLLFASTVLSQLAQLSSLSPAKQPICKDRGRGKDRKREKKEKRREIDGNERKRKKETDCFHNVDCQELHSRQSQCALSENRRVKLILFHIPSVLLLPFLFICSHFSLWASNHKPFFCALKSQSV